MPRHNSVARDPGDTGALSGVTVAFFRSGPISGTHDRKDATPPGHRRRAPYTKPINDPAFLFTIIN